MNGNSVKIAFQCRSEVCTAVVFVCRKKYKKQISIRKSNNRIIVNSVEK